MKKKMNIRKWIFAAVLITAAGLSMPTTMRAQEVSAGGDIVSSYIWRGTDCGGVSVQPALSLSLSGFSLTAWGSVGFEGSDTKEFDFTLGYGVGGFGVAITDYWFNTVPEYFNYKKSETAHMFEATVGYDFGPVAVTVNTFFAGNDFLANGDRAFSTYAEVSAPFKLGGLDFKAEAGITPWDGLYATKAGIVNVGLTGAKEIKVTDSFSLPVFSKVIFNPASKGAYFVFGISL
jgi:hypothetical protein